MCVREKEGTLPQRGEVRTCMWCRSCDIHVLQELNGFITWVCYFVGGAELNIKCSEEEKEAKCGEGPMLWWGPVSPQCRLHSNYQKWSQLAFFTQITFFFSWKWTEKVTWSLTLQFLFRLLSYLYIKHIQISHLQISYDFYTILGWDSAHLCTGGVSHILWSGSNELSCAHVKL